MILRRAGILLLFVTGVIFFSMISPVGKTQSGLSQEEWVDSVFNSLTPEQRIGQLFMVAAYSNRNTTHTIEIENLIEDYNIGGLIFFQGGPVRQAILTNRYQSLAKTPLLIAMDAEWGLGMRLDSTMSFPKQMTLGAIEDNRYIYRMGGEIARQCKRIGVHINFAPVVDVNSNPLNPVIGMRSFGESKENVSEKGIAYMKGLQHNGVMANAKHFPGHGDTEADSHNTLPVINYDLNRLNNVEFYPFRRLMADTVQSIMIAHMHVPALDKRDNMPTTLSEKVIEELLKKEMGFKGLIFTDALNMRGVTNYFKPGEIEVKALIAGNDVLLYSEDVPLAIEKIQKAILRKDISQTEIDSRVKKILRGKYWCGLHKLEPISTENLYNDLNNTRARAVRQELYEKSLTLVTNKDELIPFRCLDTTTFASVSIGLPTGNMFQSMMDNYATVDHHAMADKNSDITAYDQLVEKLKKYDVVIVGIHNTNIYNSRNYGISENSKNFVKKLQLYTRVVVVVFGNPYSLKYFSDASYLVCAYEDNDATYSLAPQLLFGGLQAFGKLPVTCHAKFPVGTGLTTHQNNVTRLRYAYPENARMDGFTLMKIDSVMNAAIEDGAMPGGQVMVVKNGTVVYSKSFGYQTYDHALPVNSKTVYDIASITKVASTLQVIMFLKERELIDLDKPASFYLPELVGTNKEKLIIRDILTHQAGLTPFLMHWKKTMDTSGLSTLYYSAAQDSVRFPNMVVPGVYSIAAMEDSLWKWTIQSDLLPKPKKGRKVLPYGYTYSDLGFYIMKRMAEKIINQPIDQFMQQNFYDRLGTSSLGFKPLERMPVDRIAPTEDDKYFRKQLVRGTVHDQGAAMFGGVGGHAGLFSNANDLAILMQMNLQFGCYGGERYLLPETLEEFSKKQFATNRRGLGWDKPEPAGGGPTSHWCSEATFGHTGFTGTAAWVDPSQQIVYIFLSNRVYPDAANNRLIKQNIRTRVQDIIYRSVLNYRE